MKLAVFRDTATIAGDVHDLILACPKLTDKLYMIGQDILWFIRQRSKAGFQKCINDVQEVWGAYQEDKTAAAPLVDKLVADLTKLRDDVTD